MQNSSPSSRRILLGISGGIAAYKTPELVRQLIKAEHSVQVVMTEAAGHFVTATTLQAVSGQAVYTDQWDSRVANGMPHIALGREADAILVAPASADFIAKLAHGFANDLLSTLCLARECPLLLAPAMNKQMWENPATQRNIAKLIEDGVQILGPDRGEQACGEVGQGRMLEPETLCEAVVAHFTPKLLTGKKVLITAGATIEMLDPVRGLTNLSSGKMGFALANVAYRMGAEVTLIHGLSTNVAPTVQHVISVQSANEMYKAVMERVLSQDVFIAVAAVADYRPSAPSKQKIKKNASTLSIQLERNRDILADVAKLSNPPYCVGFAAETEHVLEYARQKRIQKGIPMIVANNANHTMGKDDNQVTVIDEQDELTTSLADKVTIAFQILMQVKMKLDNSHKSSKTT